MAKPSNAAQHGDSSSMTISSGGSRQYPRHRLSSGLIDSDNGSHMSSILNDNHGNIAGQPVGAIPETSRTIGNGNGGGGGGGGPEGTWPEMDAERRRKRVSRQLLRGVLHFVKVTVIAILVILIMVAIGIPVNDNGVPLPGDYTKMEFDWQLDPRSYLTPFNTSFTDYNVLLDAHLHTTYSDGVLSPQQAIEFSLANGFNAIIVSDHQTVAGSLAAKEYAEQHFADRITVITAMEYTCCRIHMNLIGINESIPVSPPFPSDAELQSVINKVHDMGGMVIVNHIPWSNTTLLPWDEARLPDHPSREQLFDWGVDGFEVVNQGVFDLRTYQFIQEHSDKLVALTGSDMHYPGPSYAWTTINAQNKSAESILDEIRNRRTSFLLDASGTRPVQDPPYNPDYFKYAPWGLVGNYFYGYADRDRGQYSFQASFCQPQIVTVHHAMIGWFFLWLLIAILVLEILYWCFRWLFLLVARKIRARRSRHR
ncbi:hypothetical protein IWW38_003663 [Coemansia aciculifera]|uniref:Uncharacterized protein n=1 Tax=Coemansia aciculifera TaxID=417176 RepID=A0ACC1M0L9_9FUNG|nr:hypothetical protein IWW38_003663 [Coemansia aciculifera]